MSANPYELWEKVNGDEVVVENLTTEILYTDLKANTVLYDNLQWHEEEYEGGYLTLNEIFEQIMKNEKISNVPIIKVIHESGLWGVIFQIGYNDELDRQWIVHGITKGYA